MSAEDDTKFEHLERHLDRLEEKVDRIEADLNRYRGAVGAVLVIGTGVVTFLKMAYSFLKEHLVWQ